MLQVLYFFYFCEAMCYVSILIRFKALKFDECLSAYKIEHGIEIGKGLLYMSLYG